jgi:hypothetical protein
MNKRKGLLVSLVVVVLLALGLLFVLLWPKPPHMNVIFYAGDEAAPQIVVQFQAQDVMGPWLTVTVQGASPNTLFTWALYERMQGTYQWIFVQGTGSVNTIAPNRVDGKGCCSWQIGIFAANHYQMPSTPSPIYGWPTGQYEIKVTVNCPAPVTSNSVSEDSNIISLLITSPSP